MSADIEQLKQLYNSGLSLEQCCNAVGLKSPGSLLKRLRRHGVKIRTLTEVTQGRSLTLPKEAVINMYQAGLSCKDIGEHFECSRRTVYKYLKLWDVKLRSREDAVALATGSLLNQSSRELILKLRFEKGMNCRAIACRTGISRDVVKRYCYLHKKKLK
jgi:DNA-binding CsgD family transcriptional regulator